MTAGPSPTDDSRRLRRQSFGAQSYLVIAAAVLFGAALASLAFWLMRWEAPVVGLTVDEKLVSLRAERAGLQARADGEARVFLLPAFRVESLLIDALAVRHESDRERALEWLGDGRRQDFVELDQLNAALRIAVERPGEGARLAALQAADRVRGKLEQMAGLDEAPLVLAYTPGFVPPRRAAGELTLKPGRPGVPAPNEELRIAPLSGPPAGPANASAPTVPRYAPDFAVSSEEDPAVEVEVTGLRMTSSWGRPPVLQVGAWRGEATVAAERLRFVVPRSAFPTEALRTTFVVGSLALRHSSRTATFQLLFTVLPDRPGSFAFDQKIRTTTLESNTLVSPEILARAPAGETRTVRRCFDPPPGWRFDMERRRIVIVERLGWLDDIADETQNGGSVEFVKEDAPGQICIAVVAKPATQAARTATIGRFEATLVRDVPVDRAVHSGVRALDWREPARVTIEPGMIEWKLYIRLFEEIDLEFGGTSDAGSISADALFLHVMTDDGKTVVLQADPTASP
jgi:hypothetical protein